MDRIPWLISVLFPWDIKPDSTKTTCPNSDSWLSALLIASKHKKTFFYCEGGWIVEQVGQRIPVDIFKGCTLSQATCCSWLCLSRSWNSWLSQDVNSSYHTLESSCFLLHLSLILVVHKETVRRYLQTLWYVILLQPFSWLPCKR